MTPGFQALVIGSGGAIGAAFVRALRADPDCAGVREVSRSLGDGFDLSDPASIEAQARACAASGPYGLVIDATGVLTIDGKGPEKHLGALDAGHLARAFALNTIGPALVLRHFAPLLAPGRATYAKLSARVGSIGDNHKGGWYGYRASKAAMNMVLQTAAIELQRRNPQLVVAALQPGTVRSGLSAAFAAGVPQLLEPDESARGLLQALRQLQPRPGAQFVDWRGEPIPW